MNNLKTKVIARLIKWGSNEISANKMVNEHFTYVEKHYSGVSKIAEVITSLSS